MLKLCGKTNKIKCVNWQLRDIQNENGEYLIFKIEENVIDICNQIEKEQLNDEFILSFNVEHQDAIKLFLMKSIRNKIADKVILINILEKFKRENNIQKLIFVLSDNLYGKFLSEYSLKKQIIIKFPPLDVSKHILGLIHIVGYSIVFPIKELFETLLNRRHLGKCKNQYTIAIPYSPWDITLEKDKKSALFMLLESKVDFRQILLYFDRKDYPCTEDMVRAMDNIGVRYIAMSRGATKSNKTFLWGVTFIFFKLLVKSNLKILFKLIRELLSFRLMVLEYLPSLFLFNALYAYNYDFYKTLNVKITLNNGTFDYKDVIRSIALKDCGGICVCYQLSNYCKPHYFLSTTADVYFSFGPYYKSILQDAGSSIDYLIYSGYITDYSFKPIKERASKLLRQNLEREGVKFVIAFFDEAFGQIIPIGLASKIHDFFAKLVLDNPEIGIVHKPKRMNFRSESKILDSAVATNRYIILKEGSGLPSAYPSEASQAADLAIGLLIGGTTVLESILSGVPAFYLDMERLYMLEEYKYGKDVFVFDDLEKLQEAIFRFKSNKNSFKYPDAFIKVLYTKDPFRDGKAINRIGDFIFWVLEKFNKEETRKTALEYALRRYAQKWDKKTIESFNSKVTVN